MFHKHFLCPLGVQQCRYVSSGTATSLDTMLPPQSKLISNPDNASSFYRGLSLNCFYDSDITRPQLETTRLWNNERLSGDGLFL